MHLPLLCFLLLCSLLWPQMWMQVLVFAACVGLIIISRQTWRRHIVALCVVLLALPAVQWLLARQAMVPLLSQPDVTPLLTYSLLDEQLPNDVQARALEILDNGDQLGDPNTIDLFESLQLPPYVSLSLLSLSMLPLSWDGQYFRADYESMNPFQAELVMKDGRLTYTTLIPLPNLSEVRGYLVSEVLLLSEHRAERKDTWFGQQDVTYLDFRPVVVEEKYSDVLINLANSLDVAPPPYELHLIPELSRPTQMDLTLFVLSLLLGVAMLVAARHLGKRRQWIFAVPTLAMLAIPTIESRDNLTIYASYIFGTDALGGLLASPLRLIFFVLLAFLAIQSLITVIGKNRPFMGYFVFVGVLGVALYGPEAMQRLNCFSYVHPLEAFSSSGAALSYLAFLLGIAGLVMILDAAPAVDLKPKFGVLMGLLVVVAYVEPQHLIAAISLGLIWLFKDMRATTSPKAALAVLCFYPHLVLDEHRQEISYVKHQLLDEITLLGERNYFRMGRIIQRLPNLQDELARNEHPHLMELFARKSGLLENEIDFSLLLVGPDNAVISELNHHLTTNRLRALNSPLGRIESFSGEPDNSLWMSYREVLETDFGDYDFTVLLGNDYQNLSLVRAPRVISTDTNNDAPTPYFAYIFEVFDDLGNQIYSQGTSKSSPLKKEDLRRLEEEPVFWRLKGRNTVFFIKDKHTVYRITHKATPLKMIFARFLSLWLGMASLLALIQLSQRPGRGVLARWRRSFSMKLATFMFLASVLPTSTLGYFLINSIQKNQDREELSFAQSRMLAARNLFRGLEHEGSDPLRSRGGRGLRNLPLETYSRILGEDLSLYVGGTLINTNQPEMYRMGIMNRRLPFDLAYSLLVERTPFVLERADASGRLPTVAYSSVSLGSGRQGVLAMTIIPFSQRQQMRWLEQLEFSLSILFGVLFLMAMLTRVLSQNFLHPVSAITRSAARMAKGLINRPISISRQDELERMVAAFNTMQDRVTASQNQLRQQLRVLDETIGSMSSGLFGFDSKGQLILENAIAWKLLQLGERVESLDQLVETERQLSPLTAMFAAGENDEFDFQLTREGEVRQIIGKVRMVTALKKGDVRCIVAFEDMTDAMAANRFKAWSEMARRVAHEIKNPLTPIQLEVDYLNKLYNDQHPQFGNALDEATTEIRHQVEHLKRIATEFSDYARPLQLERAETDLGNLLHEMVEPYQKTLENVVIEREIEPGVVAHVDARLLRRSFHNLVVNALQAMDHEGILTIRCVREDGHAVIWIQDTGPGIPIEEHGKVFEAYFSTKDQGSGLGLVIARKYLTSHEGSLRIDSTYTQGTRFIAELPIDSEPQD